MRAREAVSSARLSAFATAVRDELGEVHEALLGVPRPSGSCFVDTTIAPQRRPSTTIGLATVERIPRRRTSLREPALARFSQSLASLRAEWPVRITAVEAKESSSSQRMPTETSSAVLTDTDDDDRGTVGLEAADGGLVGAEETADLVGDRREHLRRRHALRHQGRDASERGLLRKDRGELVPTLFERARHGVEGSLQGPDLSDVGLGHARAQIPEGEPIRHRQRGEAAGR